MGAVSRVQVPPKPVRFHPAATAEAEAAVRWYNERVPGLGDDFRVETVRGVERIAEAPLRWPTSTHREHVVVNYGDRPHAIAAEAEARRGSAR